MSVYLPEELWLRAQSINMLQHTTQVNRFMSPSHVMLIWSEHLLAATPPLPYPPSQVLVRGCTAIGLVQGPPELPTTQASFPLFVWPQCKHSTSVQPE